MACVDIKEESIEGIALAAEMSLCVDDFLDSQVSYIERDIDSRDSLMPKKLILPIVDVEARIERIIKEITEYHNLLKLELDEVGIESCEGLKELCPLLLELSVCGNGLEYLNGVPESLQILKARRNQISNITDFSHLKNIQELDLGENQMDGLLKLEVMQHLRVLKMDKNKLYMLNNIPNWNSLIEMNLSDNKISELEFQNILSNLNSLNLSRNEIQRIYGLENLKNLRELIVSSNGLSGEFSSTKMQHPILSRLDLSDNLLTTFDELKFPNLVFVCLDSNRIQAPKLKSTQQVSLQNMETEVQLNHIKNTSLLFLSNSKTNLSFKTMYQMQRLELQNCNLDDVLFSRKLPGLRHLDLRNNKIKSLEWVKELKKLRILYISHNNLCLNSLKHLFNTKLRILDLKNNPVTVFLDGKKDRQVCQTVFYRIQMFFQIKSLRILDEKELEFRDVDQEYKRLEMLVYSKGF